MSNFLDMSVFMALSRLMEAILRPAMMPIRVLKLFIFRRHCYRATRYVKIRFKVKERGREW